MKNFIKYIKYNILNKGGKELSGLCPPSLNYKYKDFLLKLIDIDIINNLNLKSIRLEKPFTDRLIIEHSFELEGQKFNILFSCRELIRKYPNSFEIKEDGIISSKEIPPELLIPLKNTLIKLFTKNKIKKRIYDYITSSFCVRCFVSGRSIMLNDVVYSDFLKDYIQLSKSIKVKGLGYIHKDMVKNTAFGYCFNEHLVKVKSGGAEEYYIDKEILNIDRKNVKNVVNFVKEIYKIKQKSIEEKKRLKEEYWRREHLRREAEYRKKEVERRREAERRIMHFRRGLYSGGPHYF